MKAWKLAAVAVTALASVPARADVPPAWGEFTREELFSTHFPEAPDADAVILYDAGELVLDPNLNLRARRHTRTKVFTAAGAAAHSEIRVPIPAGDKVREVRAATLVPPNRSVKAETREEKSGAGTVLVIRFAEVAPGVVLEHTYERWSRNAGRIEPWVFQNDDFTRLSRLDLRVPEGVAFDAEFGWVAGQVPQAQRSVVFDENETARELQQSRWTLENLAPFREVPLLPNPHDYRTTLRIQLTEYVTPRKTIPIGAAWSELGAEIAARWDKSLSDARGASELAAAADGGAADGGDEAARAAALFVAVRDRIATDGSGSPLDPPSVAGVVAAGRGPAFAKNLLLLRLLRDAGLPAEGILVRPAARGAFHSKWRAPEQLEHVLVRVPLAGRSVLLDASAPGCPFGQLPADSRVTSGLLVDAAGSRIVTLAPPPVDSGMEVATGARLDEQGNLAARTTWTLRGLPALEARAAIAREGEAGYLRAAFGAPAGATIDSVRVDGMEDGGAPLVVTASVHWPAFASVQGDRLECRLPFFLPAASPALPDGKRDYPIDLGCAGVRDEQVALGFPAGFRLVSAPEPARAGGGDVSYQMTVKSDEDRVTARRRLTVLRAPLGEDQAAAVREVCDGMRTADTAGVRARRSGAPSTG